MLMNFFKPCLWVALLLISLSGHAVEAKSSAQSSAKPSQNTLQMGDQAYDLSKYEGKVLILDFWASWCGPCRQSFPWMNGLLEKYQNQGLAILAVNLDEDRAKADQFLSDVPADFDIAFDPSGTSAEQLQVMGMPSTYIFGRDGNLRERVIGFSKARSEEHEALIAELMEAGQ